MKTMQSTQTRIVAMIALLATLAISFSEMGNAYHGFLDLRAALLVFLAPVFVLVLFGKQELQLRSSIKRLSQLRKLNTRQLVAELVSQTPAARSQYGFSHTVRFSENHADPMVRYAGSIFGGRFNADELSRLLVQKIEAEDAEWQDLNSALGFLTKMAPYFGMLATVIGMIKVLQDMNDFTKISGSIALAMEGTLYGLLSFTLLYSPLQRYISGCREQILKRNELIARWFVLISQQADPIYIERDLQSLAAAERQAGTFAAPAAVSDSMVQNAVRGLS